MCENDWNLKYFLRNENTEFLNTLWTKTELKIQFVSHSKHFFLGHKNQLARPGWRSNHCWFWDPPKCRSFMCKTWWYVRSLLGLQKLDLDFSRYLWYKFGWERMVGSHTMFCHCYSLPEYKPQDNWMYIPDMFVIWINVAEKRKKKRNINFTFIFYKQKKFRLTKSEQNAKY